MRNEVSKKILMRENLDKIFIEIAITISKRSTCCRKKVGAIIVSKDNRIVSTGWNGVAPKKKHCCDVFKNKKNDLNFYEKHGKWSRLHEYHAEQSAILYCDRKFLKNSKLYVSLSPCLSCSKLIIQAEIKKVVYFELYDRDQDGLFLLNSAGINVTDLKNL